MSREDFDAWLAATRELLNNGAVVERSPPPLPISGEVAEMGGES